jgi:hypothetical protein
MKVPIAKSRNFTAADVARSATDVDAAGLLITGFVMGHAQGLRDALSKHFGPRFQGLTLTSTNRAAYNDTIQNAADNSHHVWRLENFFIYCAYDCKPHGITLRELYDFAIKTVRGEVYLNTAQKIVHIAPVAFEDEHWIQ